MIDKTLNNGQHLINQKHYASASVLTKCKELEDSWKELLNCAAERKKKLDLNLKSQAVSSFEILCVGVFIFVYNFILNLIFPLCSSFLKPMK